MTVQSAPHEEIHFTTNSIFSEIAFLG